MQVFHSSQNIPAISHNSIYFARKETYGDNLSAGYFLLPRTKEETRICSFNFLPQDLLNSARKCAIAIAEAISAGRFWPPSTSYATRNDPLKLLYPDGIESNFTPPEVSGYRIDTDFINSLKKAPEEEPDHINYQDDDVISPENNVL